nr:Sn1-specific diacylglycerol lipase beta [Tanacetum cinerariifolium]
MRNEECGEAELKNHAHELAIKAAYAAFCVMIVRLYSYNHRCIDHLAHHYHFYKKGKSLKLQISCRFPILKVDNWWRGHARAFLKREASYFIVVLHHIKCVVLCVRGTKTLEDLMTDGLSRKCMLAKEDFDG